MRPRGGMMMIGRGRGGPRFGFRGPHRPVRQFVPHIPFDLVNCEAAFPQIDSTKDDSAFQDALLKRNTELTPSNSELVAIQGLVNKITNAIDPIVLNPASFEPAQIEEIRPIGSYKKGTMLAGKKMADVVIIFRTLPTWEAVQALLNRVLEDLKGAEPTAGYTGNLLEEAGFGIRVTDVIVRCLITTVPVNLVKLDSEIHLDMQFVRDNLAAIRHSRWFEENASQSSIKVLVRLLKDVRRRCEGLLPLTPWMIDLLAQHAVMNGPQPLSLGPAFKRALQLLACGLFLPGSVGIVDPCESGAIRCHVFLSPENQDSICAAAQTLVRVLSHGGLASVLETENCGGVTSDASVSSTGVVITPSTLVYEKLEDPQPLSAEASDEIEQEGAEAESA